MPLEISRLYPDIWKEEGEEGSKNLFEEELLKNHLQRLGMPVMFVYDKINTNRNVR